MQLNIEGNVPVFGSSFGKGTAALTISYSLHLEGLDARCVGNTDRLENFWGGWPIVFLIRCIQGLLECLEVQFGSLCRYALEPCFTNTFLLLLGH